MLLILSVSVCVFPVTAAPSRDQVPIIATEGENGNVSVYAYLGKSIELPNIPMSGTTSIRACNGDDCQIFAMNYFGEAEGWTGHRWMWGSVSIGERFTRKPITLAVQADLADINSGFTAPSNSVTGWGSPNDYYLTQVDKPFLQIVYQSLTATTIGRVDTCFNYKADKVFSYDTYGHMYFDTRAYSTSNFSMLENGNPFRAGSLPVISTGPSGPPTSPGLTGNMCGSGTLGTSNLSFFDGLSAGKTYSLTYTFGGVGVPELTASLNFITPGGCPTTDPRLNPAPRPYNFAVISPDNLFQSVVLGGDSWRNSSNIGKSLAPIYLSGSKTQPFNGKLGPNFLSATTEKWKYVKELDDWAQVLDGATPLTGSQVRGQTIFAGCSDTQVKTSVTVDTSIIPQSDQGCSIAQGQVIPVSQKICVLAVKIERQGVSASSVRKSAEPITVTVSYSITSVGNFTLPDQNLAVLTQNNNSRDAASTKSPQNYVKTTVQVTKATVTVVLIKAQKISIYRKVNGKLKLLKSMVGKKGSNKYLTFYNKGYSFVVKDAKGKVISTKITARSLPLFV